MVQNQENISLFSLVRQVHDRTSHIECSGLEGSEKAYLVSKLYIEQKKPVIIIAPSQRDGERFLEDLHFFLKDISPPVIYFPSYNILPFTPVSYHTETAARRISALFRLTEGGKEAIVITTVQGLLQKLIPKQEIYDYAELVMVGEDIEQNFLINKLISGGYVRSTIVEEPGDFCVRGGIIDIFSPLYPDPVRVEFFGDTVDSLRFFSAASQRKTESISEAVILPARETILKMERIDHIVETIREYAYDFDMPATRVRELIDKIKKEGVFPGIESLIPLIYPRLDTLFNYVPENAIFTLIEPNELEKAADKFEEQISKSYMSALKEDVLCVKPDALYLRWAEARETISQKKPLVLKMLPVAVECDKRAEPSPRYNFSVKNNSAVSAEIKNYRGKDNLLSPVANWVYDKKEYGCTVIFVCSVRSQADRLTSLLAPYNIQMEIIDGFPDSSRIKTGHVYVCLGLISSGFFWQNESLAIISENEIFGAKHHGRRTDRQKLQTKLLAFEDLKKSDLVVHIEHGIGRYEGLVKMKIEGATNDYLLLTYKDEDKLYLPVYRMNMASKYMGVDGIVPVLDKMGGKSWNRVKSKIKKSVEKIAGELLKLYAVRKVQKGIAYKELDGYFQDFAAGFPYEETADQLKAIDDVIDDMKSSMPMDRLVCGDVGYGKTEVALRASFLTVNNGKQVAILVPTTVLAQQHFETFTERFKRYSVNIECLSRFKKAKEQRIIIDNIKTGKVDIVIGTHRLLQKDINFKDIGLIVLDEEQRFGVKHKEKLKKIKGTVDVLALTATPIPRTLHMSMMGIRDISVISTPPEQRRAIITYISEFDDTIISEAVRREINRKGQIFFVHNNIKNIWSVAKKLQELVPEVRLDVAHGRLTENELEKVMFRFLHKEIDMLVCTTIIESGLDISSANTILVNRADRMGLSQIYQLRGRVGRSDEQAYAYLFIPNESILSKNAKKRLKVLMEHSDLGSGFQIAMSDLQIRGGGTILGASQSGHIAAVGYDMFLKLMENAMSELKGKPVCEPLDPEINITISAFIPESYIPDIDQRLLAYRRLSKMASLKEISDFKIELKDRFGELPVEAANLLIKIMLRVLAIEAGVKRLDLRDSQLLIHLSEAHWKSSFAIIDMITAGRKLFDVTRDNVLRVKLLKQGTTGLFFQAKNILKEIAQHVNG